MKNWRLKIVVLLMASAGGTFGYLLLTGPRMYEQPHIRTYQAQMPLPPAGAATVEPPPRLPTTQEARSARSPLPATPETVARGKVYYAYYCVFCHGEAGDGNGPVGESYVPKPADLRTAKIGAYSDGELLRAMLTGEGHAPVLEYTVLSEHRWYLVNYVRTFAGK